MNDFMNDKVIPLILKFISFKAVVAIKDGLLFTMPLTIIGSVFLLLANLPYKPLADFVVAQGWNVPLNQAYGATFNVIALVAVVGIAYTYVKHEGYEPLGAGIIAFCTFILTTNDYVVDAASGIKVVNVINKEWAAGKGMVAAIIIGLLVGAVYSWFMKKDIRIKMPAGVPEGVANSFTALIPGFVIITASTVIFAVLKLFDTTLIELIYKIIQTPLQGATDSVGGVVIMAFTIPFLWWFGVHGSTVVSGVMGGILQSNTLANQEILDAGLELTRANGGHIVTQQFLDQFITVTGAGLTIGLVVYLVAFARSEQSKELGKLSILPALFNINEPVLFATPVVMNPFMFVPFVLMPVLSGLIEYFAMYIGLTPLYSGVMVPWTTPPVISGLLIGGWRTALLQLGVLVLSFFLYLPFIRKIDTMNLEAEKAAGSEAE